MAGLASKAKKALGTFFGTNNPAKKAGRVAKKVVSKAKAKIILKEGKIGGKKLSKKQRGFFGARAGGAVAKAASRVAKRGRSVHKSSHK